MYTSGVRKAVIDVGSNSVLLLVAERVEEGWRTILETSKVTGLGQGTKQSRILSSEGMGATLAELRSCFGEAEKLGCQSTIALATMAARLAQNTSEFLDLAREQGTPVTVLSGDDEARFGFLAVSNDPIFAAEDRLSVIDIGGHSTELVNAVRKDGKWSVSFRKSFSIGALGLREGPLLPDAPNLMARMSAMDLIDSTIGMRFRPGEAGTAVTLGATGTNLVTIREQMQQWDAQKVHGARLTYEEVSKSVAWLSELGDSGRAALVGIEPGREHTVHAGALLLERFLFAVGAEECVVSTRGWRHGVLESSSGS